MSDQRGNVVGGNMCGEFLGDIWSDFQPLQANESIQMLEGVTSGPQVTVHLLEG